MILASSDMSLSEVAHRSRVPHSLQMILGTNLRSLSGKSSLSFTRRLDNFLGHVQFKRVSSGCTIPRLRKRLVSEREYDHMGKKVDSGVLLSVDTGDQLMVAAVILISALFILAKVLA